MILSLMEKKTKHLFIGFWLFEASETSNMYNSFNKENLSCGWSDAAERNTISICL